MAWRKVLAVSAMAVAVGALLAPATAWADTNPPLNQSGQYILANNPGYDGTADCDAKENENQDVWVFIWPGKDKVGDITAVHIGWDSDGDDVADYFLDLDDGTFTDDNGTQKIVFVTPAGYRLVSGTSTVTGFTSSGVFNLTHTCSGTPEEPCEVDCTPDPCAINPQDPICNPDPCTVNPDDPQCQPDPCVTVGVPAVAGAQTDPCVTTTDVTRTPTTPGLPKTGSSLTGVLIAGGALVVGGAATLLLLRRRRAITE